MKISTFLKRSKWPFIAVSLMVLALELVGVGFRSRYYEVKLLTVLSSVVNLVFLFIPTMMFLIFGHQIQMRLLGPMKRHHSAGTRRLLRVRYDEVDVYEFGVADGRTFCCCMVR